MGSSYLVGAQKYKDIYTDKKDYASIICFSNSFVLVYICQPE